jgi:hypothetical protein
MRRDHYVAQGNEHIGVGEKNGESGEPTGGVNEIRQKDSHEKSARTKMALARIRETARRVTLRKSRG